MPTHKASRVDLSSHADKPPYGMGNVGGVGCARLATMSWQQQASLTGARSTNFGIPPPNYFVMTHYTSDADRVRFGGGGCSVGHYVLALAVALQPSGGRGASGDGKSY
jgi:hypothetical protein